MFVHPSNLRLLLLMPSYLSAIWKMLFR
jgi:hypothetical protein